MKKLVVNILVVILFLGSVSLAAFVPKAAAAQPKIMEFDSMVGVPRPYTGATNAIRGIPGGGLPWVIGFSSGELTANGQLELKVSGLVLDPTDPAVIASGRAGTNPIPNFKAIVSCLSKDTAGSPQTINVSTGLFPANSAGNARIEETLSLPSPCIAPIVFVTSPTGSWFAATGK